MTDPLPTKPAAVLLLEGSPVHPLALWTLISTGRVYLAHEEGNSAGEWTLDYRHRDNAHA